MGIMVLYRYLINAFFIAEIVECMACSDNVVRAGLTIKHRDKDTLCQMLTYRTGTPEDNKFSPRLHPSLPYVEIYDPPTPEFTVARIVVPGGSKEFAVPRVAGGWEGEEGRGGRRGREGREGAS